MFKLIIKILLPILLILALVFGFQWKNYQKRVDRRQEALLYFQEKDYEKAINYFEEILDDVTLLRTDMDVDMTCYLAESYYQLGRYDEALKIYNTLIEKNEKEKKYYLLKGDVYEAMEDTEAAIAVYESGWKHMKDTEFLNRICDSYMMSGDYEQALETAGKGVSAQDAHEGEFLFKEIVIYEQSGDYLSAYNAAVEYNEKYPEDEKGIRELKFLSTRI